MTSNWETGENFQMILTLLKIGIRFVSLLILHLQTKLNINSKNTCWDKTWNLTDRYLLSTLVSKTANYSRMHREKSDLVLHNLWKKMQNFLRAPVFMDPV